MFVHSCLLYRILLALTLCQRMFLFFRFRESIFHTGVFISCFQAEMERLGGPSCICCFFKCLELKKFLIPMWHIVGRGDIFCHLSVASRMEGFRAKGEKTEVRQESEEGRRLLVRPFSFFHASRGLASRTPGLCCTPGQLSSELQA